MNDFDVSVIIPTRNVGAKISDIIEALAENTKHLKVEFLVIDMNSNDNSVINALRTIKSNGYRGIVLQNGSSSIGSALNSGVFKSTGKYVTFVFPKSLYSSFVADYYSEAEQQCADFVFGMDVQNQTLSDAVRLSLTSIGGTSLAIGLIKSIIPIKFSAVMFRRDFLINRHIKFSEEFEHGYSEEFIYRALLSEPKIAFAKSPIVRDVRNQAPKTDSKTSQQAATIFERVDAMLNILELIEIKYKQDDLIFKLFEYQKIPETIMFCVDSLLNSGFSVTSVKNAVKLKGYDVHLRFSSVTTPKLKRDIVLWKSLPKLYSAKLNHK